MNEQVSNYLEKFPAEIVDLFDGIRDIIFDTDSKEIKDGFIYTFMLSVYIL